MTSPHDGSYNARWTRRRLEVFFDGKSIGKIKTSTPKNAKKIFDIFVQTKLPLRDIAYFHEISQDMIGLDLTKMRFSEDRQEILYQGKFFARV